MKLERAGDIPGLDKKDVYFLDGMRCARGRTQPQQGGDVVPAAAHGGDVVPARVICPVDGSAWPHGTTECQWCSRAFLYEDQAGNRFAPSIEANGLIARLSLNLAKIERYGSSHIRWGRQRERYDEEKRMATMDGTLG